MSLIMTQSLVEIKICSEKNYMISNVFGNVSYLDANVAALYLQDGSGVNCMSGNIFYNYGLYVDGTNISSCYRPDACINTNTSCDNHIGGIISNLSDIFGYFFLDNSDLNPIN
eukprot:15308_1